MADLPIGRRAILPHTGQWLCDVGFLEPSLNLIGQRLSSLACGKRTEDLQGLLRHQLEAVGLIQLGAGEQVGLSLHASGVSQQEGIAGQLGFAGLRLLLRGGRIVRVTHGGADGQEDATLRHFTLEQVASVVTHHLRRTRRDPIHIRSLSRTRLPTITSPLRDSGCEMALSSINGV